MYPRFLSAFLVSLFVASLIIVVSPVDVVSTSRADAPLQGLTERDWYSFGYRYMVKYNAFNYTLTPADDVQAVLAACTGGESIYLGAGYYTGPYSVNVPVAIVGAGNNKTHISISTEGFWILLFNASAKGSYVSDLRVFTNASGNINGIVMSGGGWVENCRVDLVGKLFAGQTVGISILGSVGDAYGHNVAVGNKVNIANSVYLWNVGINLHHGVVRNNYISNISFYSTFDATARRNSGVAMGGTNTTFFQNHVYNCAWALKAYGLTSGVINYALENTFNTTRTVMVDSCHTTSRFVVYKNTFINPTRLYFGYLSDTWVVQMHEGNPHHATHVTHPTETHLTKGYGGNYWSDYTGGDRGYGIGDTDVLISSASAGDIRRDRFPFMQEDGWAVYQAFLGCTDTGIYDGGFKLVNGVPDEWLVWENTSGFYFSTFSEALRFFHLNAVPSFFTNDWFWWSIHMYTETVLTHSRGDATEILFGPNMRDRIIIEEKHKFYAFYNGGPVDPFGGIALTFSDGYMPNGLYYSTSFVGHFRITNATIGIRILGVSDIHVTGSHFTECDTGLYIERARFMMQTTAEREDAHNRFTNCLVGLYVSDFDGVRFNGWYAGENNMRHSFTSCNIGIYLDAGATNFVSSLLDYNGCDTGLDSDSTTGSEMLYSNVINCTVPFNFDQNGNAVSYCNIDRSPSAGVFDTDNNRFTNNIVTAVSGFPTVLNVSGDRNTISDNRFLKTRDYPAVTVSGDNNTVRNNRFQENNVGLNVSGDNNTIFYNDFIMNSVHASDYGTNNTWNLTYPQGGNYWDDWTGPNSYKGAGQNVPGYDQFVDLGGDVGGLNPRPIAGTAGAMDYYPYTSEINPELAPGYNIWYRIIDLLLWLFFIFALILIIMMLTGGRRDR